MTGDIDTVERGPDKIDIERHIDKMIVRVNGIAAGVRDERTGQIAWAKEAREEEKTWLYQNIFLKHPARNPDGNRRQRRWNARAMKRGGLVVKR